MRPHVTEGLTMGNENGGVWMEMEMRMRRMGISGQADRRWIDRTWRIAVIRMPQRARKVRRIASVSFCESLVTEFAATAAAAAVVAAVVVVVVVVVAEGRDECEGEDEAVALLTDRGRECGRRRGRGRIRSGRDRGRVPIESAGSQQKVFGLPWITP
ncbi:hypothetical protein F5Y09DRAFT_42503 [Xylaria sp. FL1042]|nr:hypothetical protein F5Y09DRAFT_42503 [Xylaria sp. FL1042]